MGMMNDKEPAMSQYTFDADIVSDLHKDAYGFRPREGFWNHWNLSTMDEKQAIWDGLLRALEASIKEEEAREAIAVAQFESQVAKNIELGAPSREVAVRWIIDSLNLTEYDRAYGGSYICFELGLPYRMQAEFDAILKEVA
jgi:hypothetical protein